MERCKVNIIAIGIGLWGYGFMGSGWLNLAGAGIVILALIPIWLFIFKGFVYLINLLSKEKSEAESVDNKAVGYSMLGHLGATFKPSDNSEIPYRERLVKDMGLNNFLMIGEDSGGLCKRWAGNALTGLKNDKGLNKNKNITRIQLMHSGYGHYWIEIDIGGVTYLFDRTAGHFDSRFPLGWYGKKENVPATLGSIYKDARPIKTRKFPRHIYLFLKKGLVDTNGNPLWRLKEWTQTELADRKPDATVIIDNDGVDIGDRFRQRIKEIFQLDEGELDRTMEMIMEVFRYKKEEFLKRRMIKKEEIRLYIVPKSQGLSGDYKDNGIVFINLLAIKELLRHYRETPVSPYMEGLLEKLVDEQSLIVNKRPVPAPKEDKPEYEPEWESQIIGLFIGVSLSHEIYGHEIGISDEKRLTGQDMEILTRFIPEFKGRDIYSRLLYAVMNVFIYESNFTRPLFKWLVEKGLEPISKYFGIEHIKDIITELGKDLQLTFYDAGLVGSIQLLGKVLLLEFMEERLSKKLTSYIKAQIGIARGMALLECKLWTEAIEEFKKGFRFFYKRGIHMVEKKDALEWWLVRYPSYVGLLLHTEDYRNAGMEIERFFRLSEKLKGVYGDRLYKQEWYIDMLYLRGKYFVLNGSKCNNRTMLEKGVKYLQELLGYTTEIERARVYEEGIYFDIGYVYFILARFRDAVGMFEKSERYKSDTARLIKLCQFVENVKEKDFAGAGEVLGEYLKKYYTEVDLIDETVYFASLCLSTFTDEEINSLSVKDAEKKKNYRMGFGNLEKKTMTIIYRFFLIRSIIAFHKIS